MAPGSIFHIIFSDLYTKNTKNTLLQFIYFYFSLPFRNLLYLSLLDLTFASDREGIDNPFYRVGCKCLIVCVGTSIGDLLVPPTGLIPWFSKLREIPTLLCCITLSSSREN